MSAFTFPALVAVATVLLSAVVSAEETSTTTVTTTPVVTLTTTVSMAEEIYETDYIYTNEAGVLTTYVTRVTSFKPLGADSTDSTLTTTKVVLSSPAVTFPTLVPSQTDPSSSASVAPLDTTSSGSLSPTGAPLSFSVPPGHYSTSTLTTLTVEADGKTTVLELEVLYTTVCPCDQ